jgi:hypothetical protein
VVDVVGPHGVEPEAARRQRAHDAGVVALELGGEHQGPPGGAGQFVDLEAELLEEVHRGRVDDGVDGVEPQTIDVVVPQPVQRVVDDEPADLVALATVDVERLAPRRPVAVGEVGAELAEVVPLGAEVVVDDIEDDREPPPVAGVDQLLQVVRMAVGAVGRVQIDAVIAPTVLAGEGVDREQLDVGDAQVDEVIEVFDGAEERAGFTERAHVELVDGCIVQ